jgi:hypothetical protein
MAQASAKYAFLKVRDVWGAKSPEEERLVALIMELKGKLKLAPELAQKKKGGKKDKKAGEAKVNKNKKNTSNKRNQKQEEAWKKTPSEGWRAQRESLQGQDVPLVRAPHGLGNSLTEGLPPWQCSQ